MDLWIGVAFWVLVRYGSKCLMHFSFSYFRMYRSNEISSSVVVLVLFCKINALSHLVR
jgi:hypothetical protein